MRILVVFMITLGVIASAGCQRNAINEGTPVEIISSPTVSEGLPGNLIQTPSPSFTDIPTATYNPGKVPETVLMNEVPISPPFNLSLEKLVTKAKEDLAQRLMIDAGQIELVEVASVTWPDGSLGCPQPGMMYTQVQVDGLLIRLRAEGVIYEYHSGGGNEAFLCK